jgi:hypothetical protein
MKGFIATTAIIVLAMSSIVFLMVVSVAAASYAESVSRREYRIQKSLNQRACEETRDLILAKNYFFTGSTTISEFNCTIE